MNNATLCIRQDHSDRFCSSNSNSRFARYLQQLKAQIRHWHINWRTRQQLAQLDSYLLKDIGVSRSDAVEEAAKPFWQD